MSWETLLFIAVFLLILTVSYDILQPHFFKEGFLVSASDNQFLSGYFPRRGDISFNSEEAGYVQDRRHVLGYGDVQGLGAKHDFCRMIIAKGSEESEKFFACALAGTENLSSTSYRTTTVKDGFKTSRDDYLRDVSGDGKSDYCAVIKVNSSSWEPRCYRALPTSFDTRTMFDPSPPDDIAEILDFYEGILFWFRFIDDLKDYGENLKVYVAGGVTIDEADVHLLPSQELMNLDDRVQLTRGVHFNGVDQFLRLGDSPDMSLGKRITLTTMRAMCMWVYFDEFGNNAHILDFGNGAGIDNVFVGILGRGDGTASNSATIREDACKSVELNNVIPDFPSGAKFSPTMTPQDLMLSSSANVDCPPNEQPLLNRNLKPIPPPQAPKQNEGGDKATLLYEVWNGKLRMQHMKVQGAVKLKGWTHICITTSSADGVRPALQIWIDGKKAAEDPSAHLPQTSFTSNNYLGKSNWFNASSQYDNRPELFSGSLFDLRGYNQAINEKKLQKIVAWGKKRLNII